jgi:hypothetical protein
MKTQGAVRSAAPTHPASKSSLPIVRSARPRPFGALIDDLESGIRDRDRIYGSVVARRLRAMGIRDRPTAPASPWQNGFAERLIGSIRRECLDHIIVLGEIHLRRVLKSYADYYNRASEHPSGYVIDEKRFCWLGCDPAGYFGFCRARSVMD